MGDDALGWIIIACPCAVRGRRVCRCASEMQVAGAGDGKIVLLSSVLVQLFHGESKVQGPRVLNFEAELRPVKWNGGRRWSANHSPPWPQSSASWTLHFHPRNRSTTVSLSPINHRPSCRKQYRGPPQLRSRLRAELPNKAQSATMNMNGKAASKERTRLPLPPCTSRTSDSDDEKITRLDHWPRDTMSAQKPTNTPPPTLTS